MESTQSASTLALKTIADEAAGETVSRCSSAGARRTNVCFRLIFFQRVSSESISRRK